MKASLGEVGHVIPVRDRLIAGVGCILAMTLAIGAKSAWVVLPAWTMAVLIGALEPYSRVCNALTTRQFQASPPVLVMLGLAGYAALSALWARDLLSALGAAAALAAILFCGELLRAGLASIRSDLAVLVAGWFVIGLLTGCALLISELLTDFKLYLWLLTHFPSFGPSHSSMLAEQKGQWVLLNRSIANWSVGSLNLLLWPTLLAVTSLARGRARLAAAAFVILLFAIATFVSDHQTSQVAIIASTVTFAAASFAPDAVRRAMLAFCLSFVVFVVPLSHAASHQLQWQKSDWAQFSLQDRFRIWGNSAAHVAQSPVLGIGADNTTTLETSTDPAVPDPSIAIRSHHPHNIILQIWLELGAIGALMLLVAIILLFREISKISARASPYALATVATMSIEAIATWNLWSTWILSVFMLVLSVFALGLRISGHSDEPQAQSFAKIWLPARGRRQDLST